MAVGAISLNSALHQILVDYAQLQAVKTSDEIVQTIDASSGAGSGFTEPESTPILLMLSDRVYLEHWASPTTYVQIDDVHGNPISKSSNMGSLFMAQRLRFGPNGMAFEDEPTGDGGMMHVLDRVLVSRGEPVAIAHIGERLDDVRALEDRARTILIVVTLLGSLIVIAASFAIASSAIEPIARLTQAMSEIGSDRLDRRIATARTDEVGKLASAFNAMLSRLQEAFARERQFISDASHELKTPLTVINANAQLLKRWGDDDVAVRHESIDAIINESSQLADMVTGMLTLAKADSGDQLPKEPIFMNALVLEVVTHARERAERKGLVLAAHIAPDEIVVAGDHSLLRQLVNNLVDNAIKFTQAGRIDVTLYAQRANAIVEVADTGIGVSAENAERLFDRFFRSDAAHSRIIEGTGLGLAIVRSIARVHSGTVSARPRPGGGSLFRLSLPNSSSSIIES
jgi:signal transduction histidine kinase